MGVMSRKDWLTEYKNKKNPVGMVCVLYFKEELKGSELDWERAELHQHHVLLEVLYLEREYSSSQRIWYGEKE